MAEAGSPVLSYPQYFEKAYNNRLNVTFEHQLPGQLVASLTYFVNFGNQHYNEAINNIDPRIQQQYTPNQLAATVANPFYHYQNQTLLPGPLFNQPTVPLSSLLVKYPLYGQIYDIGVRGARERYQDIEVKLQKRFSNGYNFLLRVHLYQEKSQINNFNDLTLYQNQLQWQDSNQPHHRITSAGTYELPFGKSKRYLSSAPRIADAVIGGWQVTGRLHVHQRRLPSVRQPDRQQQPMPERSIGLLFQPRLFQPDSGKHVCPAL